MDNGNNKQKDIGPELPALALVMVVGGLFYKRGAEIEFWFYEHLMRITGFVMGIFAVCAMVMLYRLVKKESDYFARAKAVRSVKPKTEMRDFYKGGN